MKIIFFAHPRFLGHQSMPRFANMLAVGMKERGCETELWMPHPKFFNLPVPPSFKKWMGYIDQYIVFPRQIIKRLKDCPADTLFVFTDHALGPWVPLVADRPHVIHCHDFMAQRSALGEIPENPTGWTGRRYQQLIRWGYSKGRNFISVSNKTREDLHHFLPVAPAVSEVVYNGLNRSFSPMDPSKARSALEKITGIELKNGYCLHVGGNDWYKNRTGVMEIYNTWRTRGGRKIPLLLVGHPPDKQLQAAYKLSPYQSDIHFFSGKDDEFVQLAYGGASALLFPSLEEGFGWPIAEAMASGCPVITTDKAPMTEVAGDAGFLLPRRPQDPEESHNWAVHAALVLDHVLSLSGLALRPVVKAGIRNAKRFDTGEALDNIMNIYQRSLLTQSL